MRQETQSNMRFSNRLDSAISTSRSVLKTRWSFLYNHFSKLLCILLIGFLAGSMFAGIMSTIKKDFIWDGCVGTALILFTEMISYLTYREKNRFFLFFVISSNRLDPRFWRFANIFKIGLIFGFFVDAFKVAS